MIKIIIVIIIKLIIELITRESRVLFVAPHMCHICMAYDTNMEHNNHQMMIVCGIKQLLK